MIGRYSLSQWDLEVMLYLYWKGSAIAKELTDNVTQHPQRTYRCLDKLEKYGFITSEYRDVVIQDMIMFKCRVVSLTTKGEEFIKNWVKKWREPLNRLLEEK